MRGVLFIQGAGEGAYAEDAALAASLRDALGPGYDVRYPAMPDEDNAPVDAWSRCIEDALAALPAPVALVGHSVGGSILLRYLSEAGTPPQVAGVFAIAAPFWGGDGWRYDGYETLELRGDIAAPTFLYHCEDDAIVPFAHLALFAQRLPRATIRTLAHGGHQLGNDLAIVARDLLA